MCLHKDLAATSQSAPVDVADFKRIKPRSQELGLPVQGLQPNTSYLARQTTYGEEGM
jgi:hypothetical protein